MLLDNTHSFTDESFNSIGKSRSNLVYLNKKVRNTMSKMERNFGHKMAKTQETLYKQTLREMLAFFGSFKYVSSENKLVDVRCIHANPERAVAKLMQEDNIILPIISISQTTSEDDTLRRRYDPIIVHEVVWDDDTQRAKRVISFTPRPININYEAHIWTKYKANMDQLLEQIRGRFNPSIFVPTLHNEITEAFLVEETDDGTVDVGDREERILKRTFAISVETYLPSTRYLYTNSGQIEEFNVGVGIQE